MRHYRCLDSTNDYALAEARLVSEHQCFLPTWFLTDAQTKGRGTKGRVWQSADNGNLYTSLLFYPTCNSNSLFHLSALAGVALYDALTWFFPTYSAQPLLKWPNDLMVDGSKLAGILVETQKNLSFKGHFAVIGTGLNINHAPKLDRATICLTDLGVQLSSLAIMERLAITTDYWLGCWDNGAGYHAIASAWFQRSALLGKMVMISQGSHKDTIIGLCGGLNQHADLVIVTDQQQEITIAFNRIDRIQLKDTLTSKWK